MRSKIQIVVACLVFLVLLAACNGSENPPAITPFMTVTLRPTHTPAVVETTAPQASATPVPPEETVPEAESGPLNLAAGENGGRVVSVSEELPAYPASRLIDGYKLDGGEWWTSEYPEFPHAVVFELAGDRPWTIDEVVLNPWTSEWRYGWVEDFQLYVSTTSPEIDDMGWVGSFTLRHVGADQSFRFAPAEARYVGLVITSHHGSDEGVTLNEFEVYEAEPDAIAVDPIWPSGAGNLVAASNGGRIVTWSSEDSAEWSVEHLIDGQTDTETSWSSAEDLEETQYVVFAFAGDEAHTVDQVVLNPYSGSYEEDWIQGFSVWGSDTSPDLASMWDLGQFSLDQVGEDQAFSFDPATLRYIALVPTSNYGGTEYALNEFEVYEVGAVAGGDTGGAQAISTLNQAAEPVEGVEISPEAAPEITEVSTDVLPRTMAASGASPLDNVEYEVIYSDLVPVIYHLYGDYFEDLVVTSLTNHNEEPVKLRVAATVSNYTEEAISTITLQPGESIEVRQNPPLLPEALDLLHGMRNASMHVQIDYLKEGEQRLIYEGTEDLTVYSRDDFPWGIPGYYFGGQFLATMVTPNDPALDDLLRAAANYAPDGIMVWGYSDEYDSDHRAWNTMKAVYNAVSEDYGVIYVATGIPYVTSDELQEGFWLQRLKLPYEVLESHSGMCVETTLLFASAFEKMFLHPILVMVPGHVYLGVPISEGSNTYYFLETTLVGRATFEEAVQSANESFMQEALPYIEADRADEYFWVNVVEAREEGIWPIPWR